MDPIRFTRPARARNVGAPGPPMPVNGAPMLYPPLFTLYLIRQQSGLAKAKPLSMHNKTLIWIVCRGGHRRRRGESFISSQGGAAEDEVLGRASATPGP